MESLLYGIKLIYGVYIINRRSFQWDAHPKMGEDEKHNIVSVDVSDNALGDEGGAGGAALVFRQIWKRWRFDVILVGGLELFFFHLLGNFIIPTDVSFFFQRGRLNGFLFIKNVDFPINDCGILHCSFMNEHLCPVISWFITPTN